MCRDMSFTKICDLVGGRKGKGKGKGKAWLLSWAPVVYVEPTQPPGDKAQSSATAGDMALRSPSMRFYVENGETT